MRIAELSRNSGVPVPSIKYYLRAGLLPAGERTAPNQADYGEAHIHRLRLIRALIEVGGLSISAVGDVLAALDADGSDMYQALGTAMNATIPMVKDLHNEHVELSRTQLNQLLDTREWQVDRDSPQMETVVSALAVLYRLDQPDTETLLKMYADLAEDLAPKEVAWVAERGDRDSVLEGAVVGTFIGGALFSALRSLAHQDASKKLFGAAQDDDAPPAALDTDTAH